MGKLTQLAEQYGTDKSLSGYTELYDGVFSKNGVEKVTSFLEIGIGTMEDVPSTFKGNLRLYPDYKPGGSLRMYRDFFPNANIYGIDIGEDCRMKEDRLETFIFDSTDFKKCNQHLKSLTFDIIIDDGLHTAAGQLETIKNLFDRVKYDGFYVIEDLGGGGDGINLYADQKEELEKVIGEHEYFFRSNVLIIKKNYSGKKEISNPAAFFANEEGSDLTIVTGLWNIGRPGRDFSHYIENFKKFLEIDANLFIFVPKEYEYLVWEKRSSINTYVKIYELEDIKSMYGPFWDKTQEIRANPDWYNQATWLPGSPQAYLEWYNPIVQSKMFLLNDVTFWNPFATEHFIWLDAGITNTVNSALLTNFNALKKIVKHLDSFLFLSYPYEANTEIHGFTFEAINKFAGEEVKYVCRGGLFGGRKDVINQASSTYYGVLNTTLNQGYMGTEESVFSIMAYLEPEKYRRYELDGNGLIVKYINALLNDEAELVPIPESRAFLAPRNLNTSNLKTSLYMLTFNFPEQVRHTLETYKKHPEWLDKTRKILIDNSNNEEAIKGNKQVCEEYGFEHIITGENLGINRGRLWAAKHFQESDSDFYIFLEDDMGIHEPVVGLCRHGFTTYDPNLFDKIHKIMLKEDFDFMKISFTEVFMDNDIQCSWYNVPQHVRREVWPNYDKLPVQGLDPNCPRTTFGKMGTVDGLSYIDGEVYYCNWPMIVGKKGNYKMFLETEWANPFEQTWMSYMFQETIKGNLHPAVLLASPINHNRIVYYKPEDRREN